MSTFAGIAIKDIMGVVGQSRKSFLVLRSLFQVPTEDIHLEEPFKNRLFNSPLNFQEVSQDSLDGSS